MSENNSNDTAPQPRNSSAIERLRDRTDELELIISSLTIFALLSLPGWLFDWIAGVYTHLSTSLMIAATAAATLLAGVSYALAVCFVVHLMARAYWVGLIGLRTVFPGGINWERTPGLGPLGRRYYRDNLPDLDSIIQSTDRLASSLFAVISMLTLGLLWFGVIMVVTLVIGAATGMRFGYTNAAMGVAFLGLLGVFGGVPIVVYLLDAQLAARVPRLRENRGFVALLTGLRRIAGLAYPQRLVRPVQLTLQSNTRPVPFLVALLLGIVVIFVAGNTRMAAWQNFSLSNAFAYLRAEDADQGFRSTHYEDMASPMDRLRAWPRIDSFRQDGSFVTLFLPYQPLRDNLILEQLCGTADAVKDRVDCLRRLWRVSIEGRSVPMDGFQAAERTDLRMRGLVGLVPLAGVEPGMRSIEVLWNPDATDQDAPLDDRYSTPSRSYRIPIAFTPGYELALPPAPAERSSP